MSSPSANLRSVLLSALMLVMVAFAGVMSGYQLSRHLVLDIGEFGDGPFLSGFYADEPDIGYRYRWTRGHVEVSFTGAGSAAPSAVVIRAQGARPEGFSQLVTMAVTLNGVALDPPAVTLSPDLRDYAFRVPASSGGRVLHMRAPYTLALDVPTFRPPGDARDLGIKVDRVELVQAGTGVNWPPLYLPLWILLMAVGLFFLPRRWAPAMSPVLSLAGVVLPCLWIGVSVMYTSVYLPWLAALVAVVALLAYVRPARWWPMETADSAVHWKPARWIMLATLAVYAVVALWCILQVDWIGHADYAENAVVARNLVEGRGLVVDYVAQFYHYYPGITHPADTWPLLQPLLIAPFFALFGPQTWAAKLPNLLVMLVFGWGVFTVASRLWDSRAGLLAGLLVLAHPYFFNAVLYPINDLPFAAIFFTLAWLVWLIWCSQVPQAGFSGAGHAFSKRRKYGLAALIGLLAGLLVWSKPSGVVLVIGVGLWSVLVWVQRWRRKRLQGPSEVEGRGERLPWRCLLVAFGMAGLVLLPLVVRNLLAFGVPFYSTESYDAWILRYWPYYQWENIYRVYAGDELPHPRWVVGGKFGYQNLTDAFAINLRWVWDRGVMEDPGEGEYVVGPLVLLAAAMGMAVLSRRAVGLFSMVGLSVGLYVAFVLSYWHFEGRYFQVIVPWLYMLIAWGLIWMWDRARARLAGSGRVLRQAALILPVGGLLAVSWPHLQAIAGQISTDTRPTGFVATLKWLGDHSTSADVVMTRDPWELNWYTRRRAVMIPFEDLNTIEQIARMYGVTMMQLGGPVDRADVSRCPDPLDDPAFTGSYPTGSRPALDGLYCGRELPGYRLIFHQGGGTIYRLVVNPSGLMP